MESLVSVMGTLRIWWHTSAGMSELKETDSIEPNVPGTVLATLPCYQWFQVTLVQTPARRNFQAWSTLDSQKVMTPGHFTEQGREEGICEELGGRAVEQSDQRHCLHLPGLLTAFSPEETPKQPKHSSPAG